MKQKSNLCLLTGQYQFRVFRQGHVRFETPWERNVITLAGLDQIGIGDFITQCQVGTGTTAAADTDTELEALLATATPLYPVLSSVSYDNQEGTDCQSRRYYGFGRWVFRFDSIEGLVAEAGVGWDEGLFSRVILDSPIQVAEGETLDVIFELRNYPPQLGEGGQWAPIDVYVGEDVYPGQIGPAYLSFSSEWGVLGQKAEIGAVTAFQSPVDMSQNQLCEGPTGVNAAAESIAADAYVSGSLTITATATFAANAANFTEGIKALMIQTSGLGCFQFGVLDAGIPKESPQVCTFSVAVTWGVP